MHLRHKHACRIREQKNNALTPGSLTTSGHTSLATFSTQTRIRVVEEDYEAYIEHGAYTIFKFSSKRSVQGQCAYLM